MAFTIKTKSSDTEEVARAQGNGTICSIHSCRSMY